MLRRCQHSFLIIMSHLHKTPSPPLPTLSIYKGSSCKRTLLYNIMLIPTIHPHSGSGTGGTRKSYLIHCLRLLLNSRVCVAAPTGVAAFNIKGHTLHSLLGLSVKSDYKDLEGERLHEMQQSLANTEYLIIDEMSMVGRKFFWTS